MSPSYKLIYFDVKGRAEISRILFKLSGQKFQDERVSFQEWPQIKQNYPFLQLPVLEITENGKTIQLAQARAIIRYLAQKFNLTGKTDIERAQADMIFEHIVDIFTKISGLYMSTGDDETKKKQLNEFTQTTGPDSLRLIQNLLEVNKNGNGFLVGDSLTYADVVVMNFYDWLRERKDEMLAKLPLLKQHDQKIRNIPAIATHLKQNANVRLAIIFPN
jgi:glutathione S-transferase